jgi:hypothetical protein
MRWLSDLVFGLFLAEMVRWAWPGCVESARCRRRNHCRVCTLLVPCDDALRRLDSTLPQAQTKTLSQRNY